MYTETGTQWNAAGLEDAANRHLISPAEELAKLGTSGGRPLFASADGIHVSDSRGRTLIDGPGGRSPKPSPPRRFASATTPPGTRSTARRRN
jgi:hypothetical protein